MTWPKKMETQVKEIGVKAENAFDRWRWRDDVKRTALKRIRSTPWKGRN